MGFQLVNFFDDELAEAISATDLSLKLAGNLNTFVSLSEKSVALILHDGQQDAEIVYAIGKVGDDIILLRGQENTVAKNWLKGSRVINTLTADSALAFSVLPEDLTTAVNTAQTAASNAQASYTAAQAAQDGAELAAGEAVISASSAEISSTQAAEAKADALTASSQAIDAKNISVAASVNSGLSATAASNSVTLAQAAASTAEQQATIAHDEKVAAETARSQAQSSATQAASSATAGANSAAQAQTSATQSANSATQAGASATAAGTSATQAATSATAAGTSATSATTQANIATTQAANAESSATTAVNAKNDVVTGLSAQASQIAALTTSVNNNAAAITNETNARVSSDAANVSAIQTVKAEQNLYGPNNLVQNSDIVSRDGWSFYTPATSGIDYGRNGASTDWQISRTVNNLYIYQWGHDQSAFGIWSQDVPVTAGKWYNWSVIYANHRCSTQKGYRFFDRDKNPIGDYVGADTGVQDYIGGTDANGWGVWSKTVQAPANAAFIRIQMRKNPTDLGLLSQSDNSWAWFTLPMVAEVQPNAPDTRPKYVSGGSAPVMAAMQASITDTRSIALDASGRAYALAGTQATVNGRTGGFVLDNNGAVIGFQITADTFAFKTPSAGNKTLFGYDGSKFYFTTDVKINGSLIVDGTVNTNSIADGSVSNIQVFSSAASFQPSANNTWFNVGSQAIATIGKPVRADFAVFGFAGTLISSGSQNALYVRIRRDSITIFENAIGTAEIITVGEVQFVKEFNGGFSFTIFDVPASGNHTYYLDIMATIKDYAEISYPLIALQELRR